jgi:hypothetical protein
MRWPLLSLWTSHTIDSDQRTARQQSEALFGKPWQEIAALLAKRIDELDEEAGDGC